MAPSFIAPDDVMDGYAYAVILLSPMWLFRSHAYYFFDSCRAGFDFLQRVLTKRAHPLLHSDLPDGRGGVSGDYGDADVIIHLEQFVDAGAAPVARPPALFAAGAFHCALQVRRVHAKVEL